MTTAMVDLEYFDAYPFTTISASVEPVPYSETERVSGRDVLRLVVVASVPMCSTQLV